MDIRVLELAAFMRVSEEVCGDCNYSAERLTWNMPSRTNNLYRRKEVKTGLDYRGADLTYP